MDKARPIIIVKKKGGHGGHHGGAWKVAYADFVTAMMALFIVLWLLNTSKQVQEAVGGYFKDPTGTSKKVGSNMAGAGENFVLTKDNMPKLKEQLQQAMQQMSDFDKLKSHIEMTVTTEGLRIELLEGASGTFFDSGSAQLNSDGREMLITLAQELGQLPNKLSIEGHTDSKPYVDFRKLRQLGALRRPRQFRPPADAGQRNPRRPGHPGSRLCRPAAAQARGSARSVKPAHLRHRAIYPEEQRRRRRKGRRRTRKRREKKRIAHPRSRRKRSIAFGSS